MWKVTALRSEEATNGDRHILIGATADETARVPITCEVPGVLEARSH